MLSRSLMLNKHMENMTSAIPWITMQKKGISITEDFAQGLLSTWCSTLASGAPVSLSLPFWALPDPCTGTPYLSPFCLRPDPCCSSVSSSLRKPGPASSPAMAGAASGPLYNHPALPTWHSHWVGKAQVVPGHLSFWLGPPHRPAPILCPSGWRFPKSSTFFSEAEVPSHLYFPLWFSRH